MIYILLLPLMILGVLFLTYVFYVILSLIQMALRSPLGILLILVIVLYLWFKPH